MRVRLASSCALASLVVLSGANARAQAWSVPLGGRTATMGAGVAEGHDLAAPLINPAGLAAVDVQVFGLTSSVYAYRRESFPRYFVPNGFDASFGETSYDDPGLRSSGLTVVPSGVGLFRHVGRAKTAEPGHLVLGLSASSPVERSSSASGRLTAALLGLGGSVDRTTAFTETQLDLYVGPSAGLVVTPRLRVGLAVLGLYRRRYAQSATSSTMTGLGGNYYADYRDASFVDSTSVGAVAVAGVQLQPIDRVWLGVSLQSPSLQATGSEKQGRSQVLFLNAPGVTPTNVVDTRSRDLDYTSKEPLRVSAGLAYVRPASFAIAADLVFRPAQAGIERAMGPSQSTRSVSGAAARSLDETYTRTIDSASAIDFAVGAELFVAPHVALRAGFAKATDTRLLPSLSAESVGLARRDVRTVSAGLGLVLGPFDTTFGLAWQHTTGTIDAKDLFGRAPAADDTYPAYTRLDTSGDALMFLISATVDEDEARRKLLDRVELGATGAVAAGASVAFSAAKCPKTLDAAAIAGFDYGPLLAGEKSAAQLKSGLVALADLGAFADSVSDDLAAACAAIAADLGFGASSYDGAASACVAAEKAVLATRAKLGPDASIALTLAPAICTVSVAPLEACLAGCEGAAVGVTCGAGVAKGARCSVDALAVTGGTACALDCETRARTRAICTEADVTIEITSAVDADAAARLSGTLRARLSPLARTLSRAASKTADLPARTSAIVTAVRAAAQAIGEASPPKAAAVLACFASPAADFGARVDRLAGAIAAGKRVIEAARGK